MLAYHLNDLFYSMYRDYPGQAELVTIGKSDVNLDTGERATTADVRKPIKVVAPIVKTMNVFLTKLTGRVVMNKTLFLTPSVLIVPESSYLVYQGKQYRNLIVLIAGPIMLVEGEATQ